MKNRLRCSDVTAQSGKDEKRSPIQGHTASLGAGGSACTTRLPRSTRGPCTQPLRSHSPAALRESSPLSQTAGRPTPRRDNAARTAALPHRPRPPRPSPEPLTPRRSCGRAIFLGGTESCGPPRQARSRVRSPKSVCSRARSAAAARYQVSAVGTGLAWWRLPGRCSAAG
ncbi:hypothetical protein NN561_002163 [Cricetulus griseus]